jgi:hypothetical protein
MPELATNLSRAPRVEPRPFSCGAAPPVCLQHSDFPVLGKNQSFSFEICRAPVRIFLVDRSEGVVRPGRLC